MKLQPWQSSTLIGSLAVLGVGIILAFTNPHRHAYQNYAAQQASVYLQEQGCTKISNVFGHFLQQQCNLFVKQNQLYLKPMVNLSTRRHNYFLFSIYETQFSINNSFPAYSAKTVGLLNLFWTYESGLKLNQSYIIDAKREEPLSFLLLQLQVKLLPQAEKFGRQRG